MSQVRTPAVEDAGERTSTVGRPDAEDDTKSSRPRIDRHGAILDAVNRLFGGDMAGETHRDLAWACLEVALRLTDSEWGFVGEAIPSGHLEILAVSDEAGQACRRPTAEAMQKVTDMGVRADWAGTIEGGASVIVNDLGFSPEGCGTPGSHPAIAAFLGTPLRRAGHVIGMLALANKAGGYGPGDKGLAESVSDAFVQALDRTRAEPARRPSEQRYHLLFNGMPSGFALYEVILDEDGCPCDYRFLDVNPAFERIAGLTRDVVLGKTAREVIPDPRRRWIETYGRVALWGTPLDFTDRCPATGRRYSVRAYSPGKGLFACVTEDITDDVHAMEALRRAEAQCRMALNALSAGVLVVDAQLKVILANVAYERIGQVLGLDVRPLGRSVFEALPFLSAEWLEHYANVFETGVPFTTEERVAANGRGMDVEVELRPIVEGGRTAEVVTTLRDLTSRRRTEDATRANDARLRALIENSSGTTLVLDSQATITFASPSVAHMVGYACGELTGRNGLGLVHPEDRPEVQAAIEQGLTASDGDAPIAVAFRAQHRDGSWRHLQGSVGVLRQNQAVPAIVVNIHDVTQEQGLGQASRLESLATLAGGVAHDFNNILMGIMGYVDMMIGKRLVGGEGRQHLGTIRELSERAAGLTAQLLAFSRQQPLEARPLDLNGLVRDLAPRLHRAIGEDICLQVSLAQELDYVRADAGQIEQAIMNLAVNARDAMPDGGRLVIRTAEVTIDDEEARTGGGAEAGRYVVCSVSDTGIGMDEETRRRLFEPFFTTKPARRATGLGLATAYGIITQHGGYITVRSEPGEGATFRVYLPCVEDRPSQAPAVSTEERQTCGSGTILLVEDQDDVREVVEMGLLGQGYTVLVAGTAAEARELFDAHQSDIALVVTDVVMPGVMGPDLYETFAEKSPGLRVLYVSGYTEHAAMKGGLVAEGVPFLRKPFTLPALADKVRAVLDE